ncbi:MAG TPA: transcription elongation factor GreA [Thermoflexales bacterium]|jgi:transcription elongation factor GreA|nr:transcription elongation factor GreA [Anaerolineae bacterium]HQV27975.1 transcription elongation factor GreA [Thermoflexales bacterium]HQX10491.1 transcription elongation factor GreA [Thermoflexales bacterium]HQY24925.1 transcription elongation factor GreA [Thermoflexales bacterium]HQZ54739.1 transcription elongation factor GreA [Thermoflexales bacterium]
MNETEFLTPEGFKKLEDELEFLKTKRRADVAQRLHEAMEEGETEENPEYEDAKNEQAFVEGRILTIETILGNAKLIEMKGPSNEVRLGSKLTITEVGTSDKEHYTLVGSAEADPKHGKISNESPMGKALLGRKLHEVVSVTTPSGLMKFKIVHISNK